MENLSTFVRTLGNQFIRGKKVFTGIIGLDGTVLDNANSAGTSGQVLSTTGSGVEWITVGSSDVGELNDLTDVVISTVSSGQLLQFDGESWVNWTHNFLTTSATLSSLTDVGNLNPTEGQILVYNSGSGLWVADDMPSMDETDTLDSVTGRGSTTTNSISVGDVTSTKIVAPIMEYGGKLVIKSTYQMEQGETDFTFLAFNFGSTDVATIDDEGYVSGAGFKTGGATGFLRSDGSVDTSTYLTSFTESQDLNDVTGLGSTTTNSITVGGVSAPTHSSAAAMAITADTGTNIQPDPGVTETLISFNWGTTEVGKIDTDSKVTFTGFKTPTGTSAGFLKADGSVDTTAYLSALPQINLNDLSDVSVDNPSNGDFLTYDDNTGEWVSSTISLAENDTLDSVTGRGNTTTNTIDVGGVTTDYVQFDTAVTLTGDEVQGYMAWNADVDTVSVYPYDSNWFNIGQDMHWHVKNGTDAIILKGQVVMATGAVGNSGKIEAGLMVADGTVSSKYILGIAKEDIAVGEFGKVVTQGTVRGIDTTLYPDGTLLWADPLTAGGLTNVEPDAPNLRLPIAFVVSGESDNGAIAVRITTGNILHELHDVSAAAPNNNDLLRYDSTSKIWSNWTPDFLTSYTETDPIYTASSWYTTSNNASNWDTAFGWGNHAGLYASTSHNHDDRYYTETESDARYARGVTINYSSVDNDPEVDAWYKLFQITDSGSSPVICFLRGYAHSSVTFIVSEGYLGGNAHVQILDYLTSTNNNYKWIKGVRIISNGDVEVLLNGGPTVSLEMSIIGDAVYLNQPRLSTALAADVRDSVTGLTNGMIRAKGDITGANLNISNWDAAYGWGDHSAAGYLTSYTETDPIYTASSWYTTTNNASNWDTAYGWGNHAGLYADVIHTHEIADVTGLQDELDRKLESESDTLDSVTDRGATTSNYITIGGADISASANLRLRFYQGTTFRSGIQHVLAAGEMITGSAIGDLAIRANAGNMLFSAGGSTERMRITSTGNVGIGTTSPTYKLDVNGGTSRITNAGYAGFEYHNTAGTWEVYIGTENNSGHARYNSRQGDHTWYANSNATMKLTSGGNLGIGTTSPSYKLDVAGTGNFTELTQNNGKYVRDSFYRTISGYGDYYSSGTSGWYKAAEITLTANCTGAVVYGTLYDHRYDGADAYQISVVARAECDFTSNNESHYVNVGCTILGSTNYGNYKSKIRVLLVASSTNSRTYELQFFETPWNRDTWQLEGGWTIYSTAQAPRTSTGTPRINYQSTQNADYQQANVASYSPIYYDSNDTGYYLDPNSTSSLLAVSMPSRGSGTPNILVNSGGSENWNAIQISGGNNNNGIGFSASNHSAFSRHNLSLHVHSSDSIRFHSSGWDTLFEVAGGSGQAYFKGNVGIGNASPASKLQVNVGTDQNVAINSTGGVARISAYDDAVANSVPLIINGSDLRFTNNTSEAVRITGGNVGIGTTSPIFKLHVEDSDASGDVTLQVRNASTTAGTGASIRLYSSGYGNMPVSITNLPDATGGTLIFNQRRAGNTYHDTVVFKGDGNVGIGTTSPTEKLDVNGRIIADAYLGRGTTSTADTGTGFASYDVLDSLTGPGLYQVTIVANPNSNGSGSYADYLYGKVIVGTGWSGSAVTDYIHYVQENPDPRNIYPSGGGNLTVEAFFNVNDVESSSIAAGTAYSIRIKISGYTVAGAGTVVRIQKIG